MPDPDVYDKMNAHCDVLVVGGGPAGLAAAWAAGRAGARVILADEQNEFGGSSRARRHDGPAGSDGSSHRELQAMPDVRLLPRSTVFGYHDHNFLTIAERRTDHLPRRHARKGRASASGGCARRKWCSRPAPSSARWSSPTTIGRA